MAEVCITLPSNRVTIGKNSYQGKSLYLRNFEATGKTIPRTICNFLLAKKQIFLVNVRDLVTLLSNLFVFQFFFNNSFHYKNLYHINLIFLKGFVVRLRTTGVHNANNAPFS